MLQEDSLWASFQVGTVLDSPADFYHARIPKKERKKTIVEELLADSEFRRYLINLSENLIQTMWLEATEVQRENKQS